ncbi:DUF1428 domain-containing protein [Paracoccus onubensis]|uniref:DUF1428 domain-containing protein n=1 Tax=Paracoccus onubensis TaxID=1675788 RepID=A0A418SVJ0_9RHOB|nr:DUF1428 domain-containing protein [Paracoccus onubensis]RJE84935.1 DUF1428 domain-containing protein [Paracoccus onubensis]
MTYFTGMVAAVPTANKDKYAAHVAAAWKLFKSYGATRMVETWGVDVPRGKVTDFYGAVNAGEDETIAFSWIEWPDKATADASWQRMQDDPAMKDLPEMPFDGSRMIFGGFAPIYDAGTRNGAGYYQGFLLAVPEKNKTLYAEMADKGWKISEKGGAIGMIENWGEDVPSGKVTDFYRATKAEKGEVPMFSWTAWPDRATCDAASKTMEAEMDDMDDMDISDIPFDGMRMMWAGFEPLFDSAKAA